MPRIARQQAQSGIYHIMLRGINRQDIFAEDADRLKFLQLLSIKSMGESVISFRIVSDRSLVKILVTS